MKPVTMFAQEQLDILAENLTAVKQRVIAACDRVERDPQDVKMIAVTKYGDSELCKSLAHLGMKSFGENRVAHLQQLRPDCQNLDIDFHFIGRLQRNKIKKLGVIRALHSLDSLKLASALQKRYDQDKLPVFIQVNISNETQKGGLKLNDVGDFLSQLNQYPKLVPIGLMGMASLGDLRAARTGFQALKKLQEQQFSAGFKTLTELSMGMSQDFEIAIEEGATVLRLGRILYKNMKFFQSR